MHIVALVVLAAVLGAVHSFVAPKIMSAYPSNAPQGKIAMALLSGAVILIALFVATFLLRIVGLGHGRA